MPITASSTSRQEVHLIAGSRAVEEAHGQRANPREQGHRRHKPAQDPARLPGSTPPRQRHRQRQPDQRNVGQDTERAFRNAMTRRNGRHDDSLHERGVSRPAHRLQKIHPEIEPEILQAEKLPRHLPLGVQLVVCAEFEWIAEAPGIVKHQPQSDEHDRDDRREEWSPIWRPSRRAWATGTNRMIAPNNNEGRAPTASP